MKGVVLYFELKYMINNGKVKNLIEFEDLVNRVFEVYREVCNFFLIYLNFLIGEVDVWFVCIGWIMKNICRWDFEKIFKFLVN